MMELKAGDYIALKGVSEETLKDVRDKFVIQFNECHEISVGDQGHLFYGVDHDLDICFLDSVDEFGPHRRLLTVEQVLGTTEIATPKQEDKNNKYDRTIKGFKVDVYDVLKAWKVTNPALQHLIKKALQAGDRGHKTLFQDMDDIVASSIRARELTESDD